MIMSLATAVRMSDRAWLKLISLLSPTFPVGGFSWSGGLEFACSSGAVNDASSLQAWLSTSLDHGVLHQDAIFVSVAWDTFNEPKHVNETALSLAGSAQRYQETTSLGAAFLKAAQPWRDQQASPFLFAATGTHNPVAYPVAVGVVARENTADKSSTITAYLHAVVSAQLQAALRLFPLGQTKAMETQQALENAITDTSARTAGASLDDLGSAAIMMDIAAMKHGTMNARIFRS